MPTEPLVDEREMVEELLARLETMYSHRGDGMPTQFVNPDGPDAVKLIRDLLARASTIPEGYVVVPREPTKWMRDQGMRAHMRAVYRGKEAIDDGIEAGYRATDAIWSAMISAAPDAGEG